jgi:hypothetical protein
MIAFQPRLIPDMPPGRRKPPQAREMPLPAVRQELPRGQRILERDPGHVIKTGAATLPVRVSPADPYIPMPAGIS